MTELDVYKPPQPAAVPAPALPVPPPNDFDSWIAVAGQVVKLAREICDTPFVPDGLRGSAPATAAAILAGREMGIGPMTSLQHIHVIKGKPGLSALLMRALIISEGHQWEDVDVSDVRAVVRGRRKGEAGWTEASFTAAQARTAGITLGSYPQDKLYARATVRLARRKFADVIMGMPYAAEELEDDGTAGGAVTEAAPAASAAGPAPAVRTARRRQAPAGDLREGDRGQDRGMGADRVEASGSQRTQPLHPEDPGPDLPPLPGEEEPPDPPDPAAGPAPDTGSQPPAAPAPQTAGAKLAGVIASHFRRLGFTDGEREQRLAAIRALAGRDVSSAAQLTQMEARLVADTLSRCRDRDRLIEILAAAEPSGSEARDG